ncbi:MAG: protein phosphatase 2C domain-containing protein [Rubripirellula sp.]|jgi:protein phosphatase|nr:protein phosphatase 2C domain-containing protein [Rubripirellula sp.]
MSLGQNSQNSQAKSLSVADDWNSGIVFSELTDVGMRRANNQDSSACLPSKTAERFGLRGHLFVVADGMGAHAAGELASQMATDKIAMHYLRGNGDDAIEALRSAVSEANAAIHQRGQSNAEFHNMGTTASALAILPAGAVVAHVGDSRVYRLRGGLIEQLTFDHSLVWEMEASGHAGNSVWGSAIPKNVITRSLGPNATVEIDIEGPFEVKANDCYLLCSDGLTGLVDDKEIGTLLDCLPEEMATRVLVDLTNLRGGPDNTTVVVVRVKNPPNVEPRRTRSKSGGGQSTVSPIMIATAAICSLIAGLFAIMKSWGLVVVAVILAIISAVACLLQASTGQSGTPPATASGGKGPYRRDDATATKELYESLGEKVKELRDAASQNNWMMDWRKVNELQKHGIAALKADSQKEAIMYQSHAIIETMNQLREQHNRAANETSIDQ